MDLQLFTLNDFPRIAIIVLSISAKFGVNPTTFGLGASFENLFFIRFSTCEYAVINPQTIPQNSNHVGLSISAKVV